MHQTLERLVDVARILFRGAPEPAPLEWVDDMALQRVSGTLVPRANWAFPSDMRALYEALPAGAVIQVDSIANREIPELFDYSHHGGKEIVHGMRLIMDGRSAFMSWNQDNFGSYFALSKTLMGPSFAKMAFDGGSSLNLKTDISMESPFPAPELLRRVIAVCGMPVTAGAPTPPIN